MTTDVRAMPLDAECLGCGYPLLQLTSKVCPECGRPFDPAVPSSYVRVSERRAWQRRAKPPSTLDTIVLALLTIVLLVHCSGANGWFEVSGMGSTSLGLGCFVMGLVTPAWVLMVASQVRAWRASRRGRVLFPSAGLYGGRRRWAVLFSCVLLVMSAVLWPWPMHVRFRLSQAAFEKTAQNCLAGRKVMTGWIGLYRVEAIQKGTAPGGATVVRFVTGHGVLDPVGFEYDTSPSHPLDPGMIQLAPRWFTFED